jgi:hypothetical protein
MEIKKQKFRWIGYMLRKDDEQPTKVALQWNPQEHRERGRARNRWRRSTLREAARSCSELRYLAACRRFMLLVGLQNILLSLLLLFRFCAT